MLDKDFNGKVFPSGVGVDETLYQVLSEAHIRNSKDFDTIFLINGQEGAGKTEFAKYCGILLNQNITLDNVVFNGEQFLSAVNDADDFSVIIYDEADDLSNHWADKLLQLLKKSMKRIRKKNLYIFLVTPTMFDLNKYFVLHRTLAVFEIVLGRGFKRGYWKLWNRRDKRLLYINGKRYNDMSAWKPTASGRFQKVPEWFDGFSLDDYESKKDEALSEVTPEAKRKVSILRHQRIGRLDIINRLQDFFKREGLTRKEQSEAVKISKRDYYKYLAELKEHGGVPKK